MLGPQQRVRQTEQAVMVQLGGETEVLFESMTMSRRSTVSVSHDFCSGTTFLWFREVF